MQAEMLESPLDRTAQFLLSHPSLDAFSPYATRTIDMICPEKRKSSKKLEPLNLTSNPIANVLNHHYGEMINNRDQFSLPNEPFVGDELTCVSPLTSIMNGNPQADSVRANNMNSPRNASSRWTDMDNYEKLANRYEQQQSVTNSYEPQSNFSAGGPSLSTERMPETPVTLSRAISCPATVIERNLSPLLGITASTPPLSGDSLKKRKGYSNEVPSPPTNRKIECTRKTIKGEVLELNENMGNGKDAVKSSGNGDKEKPKSVPDIPKPDYIHVRARRGQATDSHSLAERVRREKISERMRLLQDLVPGCNKITGKAGMLDEIINYVQSLQRQVEFLSMKLAAVNRRSEGTAENGFSDKEMITPCNPSVPNVGLLPEISPSAFHHLNLMRLTAGSAMQQPQHAAAESCSMELPILINDHHSINSNSNRTINHNRKNNSIPTGMTLRRTISAPVAVTDDFIQSCFQRRTSVSNTIRGDMLPKSSDGDNGLPSMVTPAWDFDLPNLYTLDFPHATQSLLSSQTFSGNMETQNLKMDLMQ